MRRELCGVAISFMEYDYGRKRRFKKHRDYRAR